MPFSFGVAHQFTYSAAAQFFSRRYLLHHSRGPADMEDGAAREGTNNYPPVKLPPSSSTPRPHRCEICQRSFREIATLRKHEQLHRADRPYVCQTCGKSFLWSSNLKVHERVHTGERPYKCKICHRCFTQSNDLRRHERNVHMRGKLYGYKQGVGAGRGGVAAPGGGGSHVNLAAYQAFAMQQRALLQQALTYESYLHSAAVTQGQMFPQPPPPPLMQPNNKEAMALCLPPPGAGGGGGGGGGGGLVPRMMEEGGGGGGGVHPRRELQQRSPVKLEQVTPPPATPGEGGGGVDGVVMVDKRVLVGGGGVGGSHGGGDPHGGVGVGVGVGGGVVVSLQHSPLSPRFLPSSTCPAPSLPVPLPSPMRSPPMLLAVGRGVYAPPIAAVKTPSSPLPSPHQLSPPTPRGALPAFSSFCHRPLSSSSDYDGPDHPGHRPTPTPSSLALGGGGGEEEGEEDGEEESGAARRRRRESGGEKEKYPCDSVMDLSMNKTPDHTHTPNSGRASTGSSRGGGGGGGDADGTSDPRGGGGGNNDDDHHHHHHPHSHSMPPPKTPSSESECEGKRDVTTTSGTPLADSGIHHCQHCNIFFYDYTMYHLHESLHMPYEHHPFRCPSCGKHCQDRIEFMFHTVWHVKYPHTIPNYEPFKDNFISS